MDDLDAPSARTLQLISDILHIPIGRFFTDGGPLDPSGTQECLRLWFSIATEEGRVQALAALRGIIDAERDRSTRPQPPSE
jgi:transcriptional regulator with XRE-family HTH domain